MSKSPHWPAGEPFKLDLPPGTMVDALRRAAVERAGSPAIEFYGRTLTYAQLDAEVESLAQHLRSNLGIRKGDRVLMSLQNSPQFVIAFHAVMRADAAVVCASPMYKTAELRHIVGEAECKVAFGGEDMLAQFLPLMQERELRVIAVRYADYLPPEPKYKLPEVLLGARSTLRIAMLEPWPEFRVNPADLVVSTAGRGDLALLIYTSGTTGKAKACMHTHQALLFTAYAQVRWYGVDSTSVISAFQPLFHVAGMQHSMNTPIVAAVPIVMMIRWDRDVALSLIEKYGITYLNAPPTMVVDLLARSDLQPESLRSLKLVTGGGAAMPEALAARLQELTGLTYIEAYGMTESMSPTHINPLGHPKRQCGGISIYETETRIVDPVSGVELGPGEVGEIVISGPQITPNYWRRPDADVDAFLMIEGKRYYRTGDLGRLDDEDYVYITDRLKRMINASGYKVWPNEVEAMLYEHPAILECAVISAPDSYRGEDVKAFIVLKPGVTGVQEVDIISWARSKMAVYKAPRIVQFSDPLPRSASNKIDWRSLQDKEWERAKAANPPS